MEYEDLLRGMIVSVTSKDENIKNGIYTVLQNDLMELYLYSKTEIINNVEDLLDNNKIKISLIKNKQIEELSNILNNLELNSSLKEILDVALENITPVKIKAETWIDTRCPVCKHVLSKSYNDGYYSVEKVSRCPNCNKPLDWK